jgi:cytochrome c oxidase cbb3-type subunit III
LQQTNGATSSNRYRLSHIIFESRSRMKRLIGTRSWICAAALHWMAAGVVLAQSDDSGERLFHLHCAECHGPDAQGGSGPDLTRGVFRHGSTDEALYRTISRGLAGTPMPATTLSDEQLWQIVRFVRRIAGGTRVKVPGDPEAGVTLFFGKAGCTKCHMVRGKGGSFGPDLTFIGSLRSPSYLRSSILRPNEEINPAYWSVEAIDQNGTAYSGIRLNEDTYSIQMIDGKENLHSLAKKDLRILRVDKNKSRMPTYVFIDSEIDDLVAYLYSLERKTGLP